MLIRTTQRRRRGQNLQSLFHQAMAGGWEGAYYNPNDLSTLFQEAAGTTAVTAVGDPIGRVEDQRIAEAFTASYTSDFSAGVQGWTANAGTAAGNVDSIGGEDDWLRLTLDGTLDGHFLRKASIVTVGKRYTITAKYYIPSGQTVVSQVNLNIDAGSETVDTGTTLDAVGTLSATFIPDSSTDIRIYASNGATTTIQDAGADDVFYIKDVVISESNLNSAIQTTAGSRPVLGQQPKAGVRNRLTYTEQFDNAAWANVRSSESADATTDPNGGSTADKFIDSTDAGTHRLYYSSFFVPTSTDITVSVYAKADEHDKLELRVLNTSSGTVGFNTARFDLTLGTVLAGPGTIEDVGSGWYRCSATDTSDTEEVILNIQLHDGSSASFTGNGTDGLYLWGAQVEVASAVTTYQKVTAWYDVSEGTPTTGDHVYFIAPDGVDDFLTIPGSASAFKFLHDGTGGYVSAAVQFGIVDNPDDIYALLDGGGFTAAVGCSLIYDDRSGSSQSDTSYLWVHNGTSIVTNNQVDDALAANVPIVYTYTYATPTLAVNNNGAEVQSTAEGNSPSAANAASDYKLFDGDGGQDMIGKLFSLIIRDGVPSVSNQRAITTFQAQRAGITF